VNDHLRISRAKMAGFDWTERAFAGLLVVLTVLLALAVGLMILSLFVAGGLVLAGWLWWWRRRLLQPAMKNPLLIEGERRIPAKTMGAGPGGCACGRASAQQELGEDFAGIEEQLGLATQALARLKPCRPRSRCASGSARRSGRP
jgi:hypothetical protein